MTRTGGSWVRPRDRPLDSPLNHPTGLSISPSP